MFNSLLKTRINENLKEENCSGILRVIGDRAAGKTTYMAALARWPNADVSSPVELVTPANKDGEYLIKQAKNFIESGLQIEQTRLANDVLEIKDYSLRIILKPEDNLRRSNTVLNLDISCKDYSGEFFSDVLQQTDSQLLRDYLNDCFPATGIMLMIDGTTHRKDLEYARGVDQLLVALAGRDLFSEKRRIALVLTKCELADLWVNRNRPKFLVEARFPTIFERLESWQNLGMGSVEYFTTSAFGVTGNKYYKPNSQQIYRGRGGVASVLEDSKKWRPFGLVSPIYWICTGKRNSQLDND
ncbi:MAG: hypothetical protein F6K54_27745 [Okeania sp. SIO3B5]|uniref:hypothetical protein n=1 Tax=Okeania sp. SIO3B5 TaxID=2607811 RepID=UPI001400D7FE|nr:hypothetical protein [Okeania sp. SIO3B5]NEO56537.1 hypothetical protein [Okeania sp. SIO3B5]